MALPPLPPNNTGRLFVDYTTGREAHTFQVRYAAISNAGQAAARALAFLQALVSLLPTIWEVTGLRHAAAGTDVTLPFSDPALEAFGGTAGTPQAVVNEPRQLTWVGRGHASGRRLRVGLYGLVITSPETYRLQPATWPSPFNGAIAALAASTNTFVTVAGDDVLWHQYVNVNFNSYWETEARQ